MSPIPSTEPSFICTFCWKPQYPPTKPKVIGSSRISCASCHAAVLNLSICWVCGEIIVRGDDVVSLGWCFWHRSCFGCLICATRVSIPKDHDEGRRVELDYIPLCGVCKIETAGDYSEDIREKGLEHVSMWDGGVSKARLQHIEEMKGNHRGYGRSPVSSASADDLRRKNRRKRAELRSSSPGAGKLPRKQGDADPVALGDDGSLDAFEGEQGIYLSILDPLGEPAFTPSRTKPLPHWMKFLSSNRVPYQEEQYVLSTPLEIHNTSSSTQDLSGSLLSIAIDSSSRSQRPTLTSKPSLVRAQTLRFEPSCNTSQDPISSIERSRTLPKKFNATSTPSVRGSLTNAVSHSTYTDTALTRELSSFPFFQNPRQPILPGSDSSWGTNRTRNTFIGSREFVERLERKGSLTSVSDGERSRRHSYMDNDAEKGGKGKGKEIYLEAIREAGGSSDTEIINSSGERKVTSKKRGFVG